jgi:hypothetical protein
MRFTISTAWDVQTAIRTHAEAAGMDVSEYLMAAAVAQMARDHAATSAFATLDARTQAALEEADDIPEPDLPSFADLTGAEQALVRRVLGNARPTLPPSTTPTSSSSRSETARGAIHLWRAFSRRQPGPIRPSSTRSTSRSKFADRSIGASGPLSATAAANRG